MLSAMIGRMAGWLGRKGVFYLALVAAILFYASTRDSFRSYPDLRRTAEGLATGKATLAGFARGEVDRSNGELANAHRAGREELDARIRRAQRRLDTLEGACGSDLGALVKGGAAGVIDNRRRCIRATLLRREIATLTALHASLDARRPGETIADALRRHAATMRSAAAINRDARQRLAALDRDLTPGFLQEPAIRIQQRHAAEAVTAYSDAKRSGERLLATRGDIGRATQDAAATLADAGRAYAAVADASARSLGANGVERARLWAEANDVAGAMRTAAIALTLIIASPFLVRLFCYFVLAPIAMRRAAIQLRVPGGSGVPLPPAERSASSVGVRLGAGEELLVRQDYLQTSSQAGRKDTQWLLSWRYPVASIATGLTFLTRLRGDGEVTNVSAVRDPFAEVTVLTLPEGAACVLQPRALAAVAQPIGRPLRVTSRWRLFRLNVWLTGQLRYLIFRGPARLVVKGGRGVRVERAERGRIFGQDQLVGFSADLGYSVTRTETFWPYLLGREPLLKDRVEAGAGTLIIEEAPLAGRGADRHRGIEGMIDAGMKLFGI